MLWTKIWFRISYQIIPGPIMGKDLVAIFGSGDSRAPCLFLFRFSVELRISALNDYNHLCNLSKYWCECVQQIFADDWHFILLEIFTNFC